MTLPGFVFLALVSTMKTVHKSPWKALVSTIKTVDGSPCKAGTAFQNRSIHQIKCVGVAPLKGMTCCTLWRVTDRLEKTKVWAHALVL
jgi:hypothetical protein